MGFNKQYPNRKDWRSNVDKLTKKATRFKNGKTRSSTLRDLSADELALEGKQWQYNPLEEEETDVYVNPDD